MADKHHSATANNTPALLSSMRPKQWAKNLIVFAPAMFAGKFMEPAVLVATSTCFIVLCLASGAIYILNDLLDLEADRMHPVKKLRPLATGTLSITNAKLWATILAFLSLTLAFFVRPSLALAVLGFMLLSIIYSVVLKHLTIIDVFMISLNFLVRAGIGALAANVPISGWFLLCAFFGALFIAVEKRRYELKLLGKEASSHRKSLDAYSPELINRMEALIVSVLVTSYALYGFFSVHGQWMMLTIPFVVYGVMRYQNLSAMGAVTGNPEEILLTDKPIQATIILWVIACLLIIYRILPEGSAVLIENVDRIGK